MEMLKDESVLRLLPPGYVWSGTDTGLADTKDEHDEGTARVFVRRIATTTTPIADSLLEWYQRHAFDGYRHRIARRGKGFIAYASRSRQGLEIDVTVSPMDDEEITARGLRRFGGGVRQPVLVVQATYECCLRRDP